MPTRVLTRVSALVAFALFLSGCLLPMDEYSYSLISERRILDYYHVSAAAEDSYGNVYVAAPREQYVAGGTIVRWDTNREVTDVDDYSGTVVFDMIPAREGVFLIMDGSGETIVDEVDGGGGFERSYSVISSAISVDPYNADGLSSALVLLSPESATDPYLVLTESSYWGTTASRTYTHGSISAAFAQTRGRVYHLKPADDQGTTPIWYHPIDQGTAALGDPVELSWPENSYLGGPLLISPDETTLIAGTVVFDISSGLDYVTTLAADSGVRAFVTAEDGTSELVNVTGSINPDTSIGWDQESRPGELQVWVGDWTTGEFVTVMELGIEPAEVGPSENGLLVVGRELADDGNYDRVQIHRIPAQLIQDAAGGVQ